jgi:hypothetical protein
MSQIKHLNRLWSIFRASEGSSVPLAFVIPTHDSMRIPSQKRLEIHPMVSFVAVFHHPIIRHHLIMHSNHLFLPALSSHYESIVFLLAWKCPILWGFASFISSSGTPPGRSAVKIVVAAPTIWDGLLMSVRDRESCLPIVELSI